MIITTTPTVEGQTIEEYLGIVTSEFTKHIRDALQIKVTMGNCYQTRAVALF